MAANRGFWDAEDTRSDGATLSGARLRVWGQALITGCPERGGASRLDWLILDLDPAPGQESLAPDP